MDNSNHHKSSNKPKAEQFATTHWTTVLAAGDSVSPHSEEALARLCERYWYPVYAYVRRHGNSPHDSQDLTQAFFARLFERKLLRHVDREGGRFRSYLLTALKNFLCDEWEKGQAQKRGGGRRVLSIDEHRAEERYRIEPVERLDPERLFERRWALTLLEQALERLEKEYRTSGRSEWFHQLRGVLLAEADTSCYAEIARVLNSSVGAVKVAVHRMRRSFRQILRDEISQTVSCGEEVDEELRHLFSVLAEP